MPMSATMEAIVCVKCGKFRPFTLRVFGGVAVKTTQGKEKYALWAKRVLGSVEKR